MASCLSIKSTTFDKSSFYRGVYNYYYTIKACNDILKISLNPFLFTL